MPSVVVPVSFLRFSTGTDMLGLGLADLPAATSDVDVVSGGAVTFEGVVFDSSVTYTLADRVITFYGADLAVLTASTGGPLHYSLLSGMLNALSITGPDGTPLASFTDLTQDVAPLHSALFGPEAAFMAALLPGANEIRGSQSHDTLAGFAGGDTLLGRGGRDLLLGGSGDDLLVGGALRDRLKGGLGDDNLLGGLGHDRLMGQQGGDALRGGAGQDRLQGGAGNDLLTGDGGADHFVFRAHDGSDTITDFVSGQDKVVIELSPDDPINIGLSFTYSGGQCIVTFLDVTLTFEGIAPNGLDFNDGGDFTLVML